MLDQQCTERYTSGPDIGAKGADKDPKDRVETLIKTKVSSVHKRMVGNDAPEGARHQVAPREVEAIIAEWPAAPKKVAQGLLDRYGMPNEATPSLLIWHNTGP